MTGAEEQVETIASATLPIDMAIIGADPVRKTVILQFACKVERVEFTPDQALAFAKTIVSRALIARGDLPVTYKEGVEKCNT